MHPFRVGFGYDVHPLIPGEFTVLGGIKIPNKLTAQGHSDADVLIHALCDALLGAAGLKDIGHYFPNTDDKYMGIDSCELLTEVCNLLSENKYEIGNVDMTVVSETPKINPHIDAMKEKLSGVMSISPSQIGIKATTNEGLGYIGRHEGIAAHAVALIYSKTA